MIATRVPQAGTLTKRATTKSPTAKSANQTRTALNQVGTRRALLVWEEKHRAKAPRGVKSA